MKITQVKDAYRNITRQFVSFLSVVIIALLAVTIFLGILFSSRAIVKNGNDFYDQTNFRDVEIISTYMFTEDDLTALRNIEGVYDVEGIYNMSGVIKKSKGDTEVNILSLSERINRPILLEGNLPAAENECCIEKSIKDSENLKIGDTIVLCDKNHKKLEYVKCEEFVITGVVYHADLACNPKFVPDNRYIIVPPSVFDTEALENCYMRALITFNATRGVFRFGDDYNEAIKDTLARINTMADERAAHRYEEIYGKYDDKITDGQSQLDDARRQLDDSRSTLDSGREELESGESQLVEAEATIASGESQLAAAEETLASGRSQIAQGQEQLDSAGRQLKDALRRLNDGEAQMRDAQQQVERGQQMLSEAETMIADGRAQLNTSGAAITNAKDSIRTSLHDALYSALGDVVDQLNWSGAGELPDADDTNADATQFAITDGIVIDLSKSMGDNIYALVASLGLSEDDLRAAFQAATQIYEELSDGTSWFDRVVEYAIEQYRQYDSVYEDFANAARSWNSYHSMYLEGKELYENALTEYNTKLAQYNEARALLDEGWHQYYDGLARYNSGRRRIDDARRTLESGESQLADGRNQLDEAMAAYESGQAALESGRAALESGESKYAEGEAEYAHGVEQLEEAKEKLEKLDQCRWVVLSVFENMSYNVILSSQQNLKDIAMTFSGVFLFVAALVIFSTLGRIIDEQRRMVGATKALGLFNREVFAKYLAFGLSGTLVGTGLGVVAAYYVIQWIILKGYGNSFVYGGGPFLFAWPITIIVIVVSALLATVTVLFACYSLLRSTAIDLMADKAPSIKHRIKEGGSRNGKPKHLYSKLIVFNMLTDKKRVIATIISVTGCCALLVGGFTIQYAIQNSISGQFDKYEVYDQRVFYDTDRSETVVEDMKAVFTENGASYFEIRDKYLGVRIGDRFFTAEIMSGNLKEIEPFFRLRDARTGDELPLDTKGIWVHKKVAETYDVHAGDDITIYNSQMKPFHITVAGVYDNHIGRYMFMTEETYKETFETESVNNAFLVKLNGADAKTVENSVSAVKGFAKISDIAQLRESYKKISSVLDSVSLICIVMSAMMAYFILLNLVSMFLNQKKRELTIMRVNGFTLCQVINYVAKEFVITTSIGIVLGLMSGSLLGLRVIKLLESDQIQFDRSIQWNGWIFSVLITLVFVTAICIPAFRKIKYLKLTDINE